MCGWGKARKPRNERMTPSQMLKQAIEGGEGILRLTPTWVPRSFLMPGRRLKLASEDLYAYGAHRGGIDERWFASTTLAANENPTPGEGLSRVTWDGHQFTLKDAIDLHGPQLIGRQMWDEFHRWPVYSKFFDNLGPIPLHMHQNSQQASLVGQEGKPESYYFPPQLNQTGNTFPHTYFGLEAGTSKEDLRRCLKRWSRGDNLILDLSKAYALRPGTGWLVPPCVLHAPGSLLTYEPQWASDIFGIFQSMVEGRPLPWDLLVKNVPQERRADLDYLVDQLDWDANTDTHFRRHHFLDPIAVADTASEGYLDRWVVYGRISGRQCFTAKELTVQPGVRCTITDAGAYGLVVTQGHGRIGVLPLDCPAMIRFGEETEDEVFVSYEAAAGGVVFENLSRTEPLVTLRYFGPDANPDAPELMGHDTSMQ